MKEHTGSYALIPENRNRVENIIVSSDDYQRQGYYAVRYDEKTFCQPRMYYNKLNGFFYDDNGFTMIRNAIVNPPV
ncbi:hypothetical protein SGGMMB4_00737 [Sodalis glossinidius str. 'morsitans']|uniref:Uncharacterized protein n=1 Tax=Sodalis glossinidius (strain morsitans) TaxID=343509 RepID=A0A193QGB5_SODGM|nr:hypothetical protein SGGMMB4_00737 [Sodalis glossinidius str. 'morsitans']